MTPSELINLIKKKRKATPKQIDERIKGLNEIINSNNMSKTTKIWANAIIVKLKRLKNNN